ncbi:MAG: glycosyltransferase, partial [Pseudomonadota bacterium]
GRLPAPEIVPAIAGADAAAVVYYARSENYRSALPNGFFQSIAAGLPVLYPDLPEIRTIAEQGELGVLVDWTSEAAISAAITELSENTQRYRRLRANAEKTARKLSWEKEELVLAAALTKCLTPGTPTRS